MFDKIVNYFSLLSVVKFFLNIDQTLLLLLSVFVASFFIQLFYYLVFFIRVCIVETKKKNVKTEPVSIVICARNEADNLKKFLPAVLSQDYPDYEVIVVDDCSEDNTEEILNSFKLEHPHLRTTNICRDEKFMHGKKLALTIGIKAAKNEWILFTDADCAPVSRDWISSMQCNFTAKTDIVLGYGGYYSKRGLLNNIIRFDTFFIALQYLGSALAGWPYMGVGRNLAYRRSLFFRHKGFSTHYKLPSGDDDIFVNQVAKKKNTKVEVGRSAHTRSEPEITWRAWFRQKKRHLTTWSHFRTRTNIYIGLEVMSRMIYYFSFVLLLAFYRDYMVYFIGFFIVRFLVQIIIFKIVMNRLREKYLLVSSLLYDIFLPFINFGLVISNIFSRKRNTWN